MNSAQFIKEGKCSTPVENGIALLDCSLADEHVCIVHCKADPWAKFSVCACCRGNRRWHCCYPLLDCHAFVNEGRTPVALLGKEGLIRWNDVRRTRCSLGEREKTGVGDRDLTVRKKPCFFSNATFFCKTL